MKYKGKYVLRLILTLIFLGCSFVAVSYMISFINLKNVESNLYIKLDEASYQIKEELNTSHKNELGETIYDYPVLNGDLSTLTSLVKNYYLDEIVPFLFEYEFLK